MFKRAVFTLILLVCFSVSICSSPSAERNNLNYKTENTSKANINKSATIETKENHCDLKVVSLAPNITEIIYALDAKKMLTGVCEECVSHEICDNCKEYEMCLACEICNEHEKCEECDNCKEYEMCLACEICNEHEKCEECDDCEVHEICLACEKLELYEEQGICEEDNVLKHTNVGSPVSPSIELIVSLKPDLVISSTLTGQSIIDRITKTGIKVLQCNKLNTISDIYDTISAIGNLLGKNEKAALLCKSLKSKIISVQKLTNEISNKKTAIYIIGLTASGYLYAATPDTYIDEILTSAGLINASDGKHWTQSTESLVLSNPDYIFIPNNNEGKIIKDALQNKSPYAKLSGKIVEIDADLIERPGIGTYKAIESLYTIVYKSKGKTN